MRRRLIVHEKRFPLFYTTYFIEGRVFFRIFTFYIVFDLCLNWLFSTRVCDDRKYVCGRRLYSCINTRKFKRLVRVIITSLPEIKKCHGRGASFATHLRTMKVYNTQPVSFTIKVFSLIFFFGLLKCSLVLHNQPCAYAMHSLKHVFLYDRTFIYRESEDY